MMMQGNGYAQKLWSDEKKLEYSRQLHAEMDDMYQLISQMTIICLRKGLRLVIENPYSTPHHLTDYWPIKPKVIDSDRRLNGDHFKKPTQYWFINCEPKNNLVFEPLDYVPSKTIENTHNKVERSMIHPQYANRFIRQYLIDREDKE